MTMILPNQPTNGAIIYEACPRIECYGFLEEWEEMVFETHFQVKGCSVCSGFWAFSEGGWTDSVCYWQWLVDGNGRIRYGY